MTPPYIILKTLDNNTTYDVRKGSIKRDFLDNTQNAHGYHCQPMTTANLHGWEFVLREDVEVIWDGISNTESHHVKVLRGEYGSNGKKIVDTTTANATITFNLDAYIQTDEDHYCLLMGPPNHFVQGAKPMSALIRSDWYKTSPLQYCWQITTPNKPVVFSKGTPFLFMLNYPKNLIESTNLLISTMTKEDHDNINSYQNERQKYYQENPGKFPNMYRKGINSLTENSDTFIDKIYKPSPGEVTYE